MVLTRSRPWGIGVSLRHPLSGIRQARQRCCNIPTAASTREGPQNPPYRPSSRGGHLDGCPCCRGALSSRCSSRPLMSNRETTRSRPSAPSTSFSGPCQEASRRRVCCKPRRLDAVSSGCRLRKMKLRRDKGGGCHKSDNTKLRQLIALSCDNGILPSISDEW